MREGTYVKVDRPTASNEISSATRSSFIPDTYIGKPGVVCGYAEDKFLGLTMELAINGSIARTDAVLFPNLPGPEI